MTTIKEETTLAIATINAYVKMLEFATNLKQEGALPKTLVGAMEDATEGLGREVTLLRYLREKEPMKGSPDEI